VAIHPTYGMTETASQVATARPEEAFTNPERVGRPLAFTRVRAVVDGAVLPPTEPGELVVSGPTVMEGYYGDPETNDRVFGPYGFHTGDVGLVEEDGSLRVLGRLDDAIITGGENVHPAEVERALAGAPGVAAACAFGVPDERWGQLVAAAIVPGERLDLASLHAWLSAHLPAHLRPRRLAVLDALPLLPSGKIDRRALARQLASPS
jgi:O-succinylbenzoic acid--CoA ligase